MSRKTHNRSTRNTRPKSLIGKAIENTLSTSSDFYFSSPPTIKADLSTQIHVKTIEHANDCIEDPNVFKATNSVESFCNLLEDVAFRYNQNSNIIHQADLEICDLLHEAELLPSMNARDGYKLYSKLRAARIRRRTAKTENAILTPVYDFVAGNGYAVEDIKRLKEQCAKAHSDALNAHYVYRVQEDKHIVDF